VFDIIDARCNHELHYVYVVSYNGHLLVGILTVRNFDGSYYCIYGNGNWHLFSRTLPTLHKKHLYHMRIKPVNLQ